jgi:hypothetical protein
MAAGRPPILLADIGEIIGSVFALLATLAWVLKQVFDAKKEAPRAGGGAAAAGKPAPAQAPAAAGGKPPGQQADPLRAQVEEFLRRAGRGGQGNQPRGQQRPAGPAANRDIEILLDDEAAMTPERRPLAEPLRPIEPAVASGSPRQQQPGAPRKPRRMPQPRRETVAEHVTESVAAHAKGISEQTARLGQRIIEDDHQFDVQLKAKFDHTVGTITSSPVTATEQTATFALDSPAAQIAAMLANPDGVRQAMILNEIIRRPSDRW